VHAVTNPSAPSVVDTCSCALLWLGCRILSLGHSFSAFCFTYSSQWHATALGTFVTRDFLRRLRGDLSQPTTTNHCQGRLWRVQEPGSRPARTWPLSTSQEQDLSMLQTRGRQPFFALRTGFSLASYYGPALKRMNVWHM